jgi:hypothetical protein
VCTLSTGGLIDQLSDTPGVAITGGLYTANLGIEPLVRDVVSNPRIWRLVPCGRNRARAEPSLATQWAGSDSRTSGSTEAAESDRFGARLGGRYSVSLQSGAGRTAEASMAPSIRALGPI